MPSFKPQLDADNLKCSSVCPNPLFGAARFTVQYVRSVCQDVSPWKCVLLSEALGCLGGWEALDGGTSCQRSWWSS